VTYSPEFYSLQKDGSLRSARRVLPHLIDLIELASPKSLVDVGCGVGTWLAAARELGIADVLGVDGAYVDRSQLQIPEDRFVAVDLTEPFTVNRTFDAALCLEVGEHLPESKADQLVESLTRLAPIVMYSAAVPRQSGEDHLNEQWQTWWVDRFAKFRFVALDVVRRRIWDDREVEWWYAQNILLMVREDHLRESPRLSREHTQSARPCSVVHPEGYLNRLNAAEYSRPRGLREWLAAGPALAGASLRRLLFDR
jgi:SAM-dependent methyltransferase